MDETAPQKPQAGVRTRAVRQMQDKLAMPKVVAEDYLKGCSEPLLSRIADAKHRNDVRVVLDELADSMKPKTETPKDTE